MSEKLVRPPLAYEDAEFLQTPEARSVRMLSEYLKPLRVFRQHKIHDTVAFFGSARITQDGPMGEYYEAARGLAGKVTQWSDSLHRSSRHFVVSTGGGPGIMEAANRGASEAGGKTIGLNIRLPFEQQPNPYITPELSLEFGYFFLRKFWFAYLAKALVVFPGGFGTLDEMFELLTLVQTQKLDRRIQVILYGSEYWDSVIKLDPMEEWGAISAEDQGLIQRADTPEDAMALLSAHLTTHHLEPESPVTEPALAKTRA